MDKDVVSATKIQPTNSCCRRQKSKFFNSTRKLIRSYYLFLLSIIAIHSCTGVDRSNFKTCQQSSFCRRQRSFNPSHAPSHYALQPSSINIDSTEALFTATLEHKTYKTKFPLKLHALGKDTFRLTIDELSNLHSRYSLDGKDIIVGEPIPSTWTSSKLSENSLELTHSTRQFIIDFNPFKLTIKEDSDEILSINSDNLLNVEHFREKPAEQAPVRSTDNEDESMDDDEDDDDFPEDEEGNEIPADGEKIGDDKPVVHVQENEHDSEILKRDVSDQEGDEKVEFDFSEPINEDGMWEENFKTHRDSKPRGPESIGVDINMLGFKYLYGLPEHADRFWLRDTTGIEPYRLYNLDVFEYELDETMALYGSVPWIVAHNAKRSLGVLWLNPSETWVDIKYNIGTSGGMFTAAQKDEAKVHWMSESGIVDIWIMLGPKPSQVLDQLTYWSGRPIMPSLWSLGYHQCRWNYKDEKDVASVDEGFEEHDMPYDVIWLDIEHTDGKRYFTWDNRKFPTPSNMIDSVASRGRKMVTIVDPHIKVDNNYPIYSDINRHDLWVKKNTGQNYEGWCWPGNSGYPDFTNEKTRAVWASKFQYSSYIGSTPSLFTWNDMNEPSVFNGPEITMHKDAIHTGNWEHRHVHNLYGLYVHVATVQGQIERNKNTENVVDRPFVLSRAFFVGTQRAGAIWTGDNKSSWKHMQASVPMCLSIGISGIPFIGADVGGFFGNPDAELMTRWYQHGVLQPFFRSHAHLDSKRREPWIFGEPYTTQIRQALRFRYRILHYIYTINYEASQNGSPVMRPMFFEFPEDTSVFEEEKQWMLGSALLAASVPDSGQVNVEVTLPGNTNWYRFPFEVDNFKLVNSKFKPFQAGKHTVSARMDEGIPVFIRGGSLILTKERPRRNSVLMIKDPYTLYIALDATNQAKGTLYEDDGRSLATQSSIMTFHYRNGVLYASHDGSVGIETDIERIVVLKMDGSHKVMKKPNLKTGSNWSYTVQ